MALEELTAELEAILALEEQSPVEWDTVERLCLRTIKRLNTEAEPQYPHAVVYHFLDDADVRRKDPAYARMQRDRLREWLRNGP